MQTLAELMEGARTLDLRYAIAGLLVGIIMFPINLLRCLLKLNH